MGAAQRAGSLESTAAAGVLASLYGARPDTLQRQKARYRGLGEKFQSAFPGAAAPRFFSTPGRTEVCGNHTDHNGGRVLAAAVDLDAIAVAAPTSDGLVTVESEGYPRQSIRIDDLARKDSERSTATALTRGVAARMKDVGHAVGGFCACVTSDVLKGSGLSSSASYEVLIATILNHFYNDGSVPAVDLALIAQYSENEYFGKPCGLMDQTTCALGGFVTIDFRDFVHPRVRSVSSAFSGSGYVPVIVDTGGSHADLTDDYAAVKDEMKDGVPLLRGELPARRPAGRGPCAAARPAGKGERPRDPPRPAFLRGRPSRGAGGAGRWRRDVSRSSCGWSGRAASAPGPCCRTATPTGTSGSRASRLPSRSARPSSGRTGHGGCTAAALPGRFSAFVPDGKLAEYLSGMRAVFGPQSCHALSIRATGAVMLDI